MVYIHVMLLGEIVLGKFGRFHGVHIVNWSNNCMADKALKVNFCHVI